MGFGEAFCTSRVSLNLEFLHSREPFTWTGLDDFGQSLPWVSVEPHVPQWRYISESVVPTLVQKDSLILTMSLFRPNPTPYPHLSPRAPPGPQLLLELRIELPQHTPLFWAGARLDFLSPFEVQG